MSNEMRVPKLALLGASIGAVVGCLATALSADWASPGHYLGSMAGAAFCGGFVFIVAVLTRDTVRDIQRMGRLPK
ncbi:hypothetical protein [Aureimonas jatrophae]|uniref:Lipoprotein n=1 Tax=Aureimonas jatrophae TaxID=1166073 RepID=A0A1H0HYG9_9HYPH|nr:hypothetical protein [Aureimonas jatrophae]MBB3950844.1 hypothetical protein [Aureimonas jatrophae]SDO24183.1 hypothetical protein SAMN05192530_104351 [Aureimonas jatrophae]